MSPVLNALVLAGALALAPISSLAQAIATAGPPAPDKSGFSFLDPTPIADLRALCTDRPTKSTSPCTVDAGHIQIESDIFNVTVDRSGGQNTTTWLVTNPTIKFGLTNTLDAEINLSPYISVVSRDRASGARTAVAGIGDLYLRLKWALLGDDGGKLGIALSPYIKVPTGRIGVGNGAVEAGLITPINLNLPAGWSVVVDPEIDLLKNANNDGRHANTVGLISLSRGVSRTLTLSAEIWTDTNFDPSGSRTQVSADVGAAYIPARAPNLQFDGGVNFGLNRDTPAAQAYLGISTRF